MPDDITHLMSSDDNLLIHAIIFVSLLLGGFGLPIPEDIPVIIAGVVAARGVVSAPLITFTCYFGVVIADLLIYGIGYKLGPRLVTYGEESRFLPAVTQDRVERIREKLCRRQFMCIFLGRHLFPLRSVTFLTAGALRVPFLKFLISDLIAALVSVLLMVSLGYYLGEQMTPSTLKKIGEDIHYYAILGTALIILLVIWKFERKRHKAKLEASSQETNATRSH